MSSTGHLHSGLISIPPDTLCCARCRGLRVKRCPGGHPLSRTHPETLPADTRCPIPVRIKAAEHTLSSHTGWGRIRDGKSVSSTGHLHSGLISIPPDTLCCARCRGLRVKRCPGGHPLSRTHPETLPADTRCPIPVRIKAAEHTLSSHTGWGRIRDGKSVSSTGHLHSGLISIPPDTLCCARCRGLRVKRCPGGHPLSRTHPETLPADTRCPIPVRIKAAEHTLSRFG